MSSLHALNDVIISQQNTLAVPAIADALVVVSHLQDVQQLPALQERLQLPILLLGSGSNVVLPQRLHRLVVKLAVGKMSVHAEDDASIIIDVAAGYNWHQLVYTATQRGWFGLEKLALIPGTVGAAPLQNIGAYGASFSDCCVAVEYYDLQQQTWCWRASERCEFGYRTSWFAHQRQLIVTQVRLRLAKFAAAIQPEYQQLRDRCGDQLAPMDVLHAVIALRTRKLHDPQRTPNAGSFFHNPVVDVAIAENICTRFPQIKSHVRQQQVVIPAAALIEHAGLKGFCDSVYNGAAVSGRHALCLINCGHATGNDFLRLAKHIQRTVLAQFGVLLTIEPQVIQPVQQ